jgi:Ras-related protein Rab-2A
VLVYDVTRKATLKALESWVADAKAHCGEVAAKMLLLANKIDAEKHELSEQDGQAFAKKHGMLFMECSAKTQACTPAL